MATCCRTLIASAVTVLSLSFAGADLAMTAVASAGQDGQLGTVTFTVDRTLDTADATPGDGVCADAAGVCSLRAAIMEANALAGTDTIAFNIAGSGTHTIRPTLALPIITEPVVIDGYTQPGASPNSNGPDLGSNAVITIELDGSWAGGVVDHALRIDAGSSTIRGLVINRFPMWGIVLTGGGGNTIAGNFIGTNTSGTSDYGNTYTGVSVSSSGNTIGGTTPEARNVISGNNGSGVIISGGTGNFVQGNFIGTDKNGVSDLGNLYDGVRILTNNNTVGGTTPEAGNIISGNEGSGVVIDASGNVVQGNLIGTQVNGSSARGNGQIGVRIGGFNRNNNTIGGSSDGAGNTIAFNGGGGVFALGGTGNSIDPNSIFSNGGLGIDLGGDGVTPNDAGDGDTGANNLQNFPDLTSAIRASGTTIVEGTLDSAADTEFLLEFFSNPSCDSSGFGEGQVFLGSDTVTTDGSGDANFTVILASAVLTGHVATATATDPSGNTSEFSRCINVVGPVIFTVNTVDDTNDGSCNAAHCSFREAIGAANSHSGFKDTIAFNIPGDGPHSIQVETPLPDIVQPVIIDGYTQPGASPNTNGPSLGTNAVLMIELQRGAWGGGCLRIRGGNSTVRGLAINRFNNDAILLFVEGGNVIEGNFIGTDITGTVDLGNRGDGIAVDSDNNTIGGTTPAASNVISGNSWGLYITTTGNIVQGNLIGTDSTGTAAISASVTGLQIRNGGNTIGGTTPGARNVVAGCGYGINIRGVDSTGIVIEGNFIGTDVTGTAALRNATGVGIYSGAANNRIGGTTPGAGNVISGNSTGVEFAQDSGPGNLVLGNFIGTDPTGTVDVGNSMGINIASSGNTIGGTASGAGNLISGNNGGLYLYGDGNLVQGNLIGTDINGTADLGNNVGVSLRGASNTVGGTTAQARNVVSGNNYSGIEISGTGSVVQGNFIGTDISGTVALANTVGITLQSGAASNIIGGTAAGAGNVISGNLGQGVLISGAASNLVQGNLIGTDAGGTVPLGNGSQGVRINYSPDNIIGGTEPGAGNVISGNGNSGIEVSGSDSTGNWIQGNLIGVDISGIAEMGNAPHGVIIKSQASNNTVGGTTAGARNVISGNARNGVELSQGSFGNAVLGNFIGTDVNGTAAIGNSRVGVYIYTADNNIGDDLPGAGNLISGNGTRGIAITGSSASGNVVQGNYIGTDVSGTIALGSGVEGVNVGGPGNTIGGTTPQARNLISGIDGIGVGIHGWAATGNLVQGNFIGTQADGTSPMGNTGAGVDIQSADDNTIGGTVPGAANTIAFNGGDGVYASFGTGNAFRANSIFANASLGIELRNSGHPLLGVTPNDPDDGDTGSNNLQNYPELASASSGGGITVIQGSLDSVTETDYAIDFYANVTCDPSGHGEGESFLGSTMISIGLMNPESFAATLAMEVPVDHFVTATATDPLGNTSEFSQCTLVIDGDCNNNGTHDFNDIEIGTSTDCNFNGIPDDCDVDPTDPDGNGLVSDDADGNGFPDECLLGDLDGNGLVDLDDFGDFVSCVIGSGAPVVPGCGLADLDGDGDVDLIDFKAFQLAFGMSAP